MKEFKYLVLHAGEEWRESETYEEHNEKIKCGDKANAVDRRKKIRSAICKNDNTV